MNESDIDLYDEEYYEVYGHAPIYCDEEEDIPDWDITLKLMEERNGKTNV